MANGWFQLERGKEVPPHPTPVLHQLPVSIPNVQSARTLLRRPIEPGGEPEAQKDQEQQPAQEEAAVQQLEQPPGETQHLGEEQAGLSSQTVGRSGATVAYDLILHETLERFVHRKTVERTVHAKGYGALGHFVPYQSMAEYTELSFLQKPGVPVATASRFSLAVSNRGTPDTSRNVRGFSTKFYAPNGVFDLLCNHIPVFSVRDAIRFPESIQAFEPSPINNLMDPNRFWSFVAKAPESIHFVVWLYSDVGTIKSLRHLRTYGVNTYIWRNEKGQRRYVKYHWLPVLGAQYITAQEAAALAAKNPDIAGQDLYDALAAGEVVEYELAVQLMPVEEAAALPYNPLDDTKLWEEARYPLVKVGRLTLEKNPENYREQVEKLAFSPANLLPGAELSDDKMLQGRSFIYWDAQRRRLGSDFRSIPANGQESWVPSQAVSSCLGMRQEGEEVRADLSPTDDFTQAGEYYQSLDEVGKEHLVQNLIQGLLQALPENQRTVLGYLGEASSELAEKIKEGLPKA